MGLQAARARGRIGGRKPKIKPNQRAEILRMVNSGKTSAAEAARLFGIHRSSVSRMMSQANAEKAIAVG
jgi:DNA invertase Pin-like site-specific DNA recombinase